MVTERFQSVKSTGRRALRGVGDPSLELWLDISTYLYLNTLIHDTTYLEDDTTNDTFRKWHCFSTLYNTFGRFWKKTWDIKGIDKETGKPYLSWIKQIHFGSSNIDVLEFGKIHQVTGWTEIALGEGWTWRKRDAFPTTGMGAHSWMRREERAFLPVFGYIKICFEVWVLNSRFVLSSLCCILRNLITGFVHKIM